VQVLKGGAAIDDCGPCVVMATPSMLQSGLSRDLFEAWCESSQNTVIIADFAVQGTLARDILSSPTHVMSRQGVKVSELNTIQHWQQPQHFGGVL
jgi:cleavage and polyadenylation specificity factor subunit 3